MKIIVALKPCVTHETRIGRVHICRKHEADLHTALHGGDVPSWHWDLGMAVYKGVARGESRRELCGACRHEALAARSMTGVAVDVMPYDTERGLVELVAA